MQGESDMKKSFRNRVLAVCMAASMSFLLLSGFDSSLTVEDVTKKLNESLAAQGGLNCDVQGIADLSIDVSAGEETQSMGISGSLDYSVQFTLDPFVMSVRGILSGDASAMGMSGGMEIEMYLVEQDDGTGIMYVRMPQEDDAGWHAAALASDYMDSTLGAVKAAFGGDLEADASGMGLDLSSLQEILGSNASLAPEAVNVNGVDCYEITQTVDGEALYSVISEVLDAMPQAGLDSASLAAFQMLFNGIRMDLETDCAVDDFAPVYASVDLGGSDFSTVGQMFGAMMMQTQDASQTPDVSVNVNALNLSMNYGDVPEQIDIPAQALAAQVETTLSMEDLTAATQSSD